MTSQLNVDTIVDKAGSGGSNVKMANTSTYVSDGGNVTQNTVQGLAKVFSYLDGYNATIIGSFNITSSTDEGTGNHMLNIANNMANANFAIGNNRSRGLTGRTTYDGLTCNDKSTSTYSANISQVANDSSQDNSIVDCIIFGDLA